MAKRVRKLTQDAERGGTVGTARGDDEPYKPNKYTRYIPMEDWRRWNRKGGTMRVIDPGFINEPGEEPKKTTP